MPNSSAGHGWSLKDSVHKSLWTSGNILPQQMVDILDAYKEDEECSNVLRYEKQMNLSKQVMRVLMIRAIMGRVITEQVL